MNQRINLLENNQNAMESLLSLGSYLTKSIHLMYK